MLHIKTPSILHKSPVEEGRSVNDTITLVRRAAVYHTLELVVEGHSQSNRRFINRNGKLS
jgi:hypothetical protein